MSSGTSGWTDLRMLFNRTEVLYVVLRVPVDKAVLSSFCWPLLPVSQLSGPHKSNSFNDISFAMFVLVFCVVTPCSLVGGYPQGFVCSIGLLSTNATTRCQQQTFSVLILPNVRTRNVCCLYFMVCASRHWHFCIVISRVDHFIVHSVFCTFYARLQNRCKVLLPSWFLSAWNTSAATGRIFMKFDIWVFFENLSRQLKLD